MKKIVCTIMLLAGMTQTIWAQTPVAGQRQMLTWDETEQQVGGPAHAPIHRVIGRPEAIPAIPVVLVNFSNRSFVIDNPVAAVDSMFNAKNWNLYGATGSVRQYFEDASYGAYSPRFDIYGPVTVSKSDIGYGKFCPGLPKEVADSIDRIVDFSQYDANNDGIIDLMYIVYAGLGQQDGAAIPTSEMSTANVAKLIWPHWGSSASGTYDGKQLKYYEASNELDAFMLPTHSLYGIGLACHEFCHALGLPDLYRTSGSDTKKRLGSWDIMDYGCYNNNGCTPATLSAWERWFMGWLTPTLLRDSGHYELGELQSSNQAYLITQNGEAQADVNSTEWYYLLENRQQTGWDDAYEGTQCQGVQGVLGHGMLLYKIKRPSATSNWQGCNNSEPFGVDIVEADNLRPNATGVYYNGFYGKPGDCFPTGATSYQVTTDYGFKNVTEDTIAGSVVIGFDFTSPFGVATAVEDNRQAEQPRKVLIDGQVLLQKGNDLYNLRGEKVFHPVPPRQHRVPAYPGVIQRVDADGDTIAIYLRGDERGHYVITVDGYQIQERDNRFYYVDKKGNVSKRKAKNESLRSWVDKCWLKRKGVKK